MNARSLFLSLPFICRGFVFGTHHPHDHQRICLHTLFSLVVVVYASLYQRNILSSIKMQRRHFRQYDERERDREIESIDEKDKRTNGGNVKMDCYCTHYCSHRNSIYSVRASKAFLEVAHSTHCFIVHSITLNCVACTYIYRYRCRACVVMFMQTFYSSQ